MFGPGEARRVVGEVRARQVVVVNYAGRSADLWWQKNAAALSRIDHLGVVDIPQAAVQELGRMAARGMTLQCLIQDGHIQVIDATTTVWIEPVWRKRAS